MDYYIIDNGQQYGPMAKDMLINHNLTFESMVWCAGMPEWTKAKNVPELVEFITLRQVPQFTEASQPPQFQETESQYYIILNGVQSGPFTIQQLSAYPLTAMTPIWKQGTADWVKVKDIPELSHLIHPIQNQYQNQTIQTQYQNMQFTKSEYKNLAIIAIVVGFLFSCIGGIFGIIALTSCNKAESYYAAGDEVNGRKSDNNAKTMTTISFVFAGIGLIVNLIYAFSLILC